MNTSETDDPAEATLLRLVTAQGRSISPEDAARALTPAGEDFRRRLPAVRAAAVRLAHAGKLAILRKGKPVDPDTFKGVYRLGLPD